jgi:hypothetical protein
MHYKAPDNSIHFLDSTEYEHLLPAGSVQITQEEANVILEAQAQAKYQEWLAAQPTKEEQIAKLQIELDALKGLTQ